MPIGIFTKKITYRIFLVPLAGIVHQTGVSNSSQPGNVSLDPSGIGVVPNSMPRAWVLAFQGLDERAQFSSHIAIHGKSCWRKQYPTPKRSFQFTARMYCTCRLVSICTPARKPRLFAENG